MLNELPISPAHTPYDYLAIRESYRQRLGELDLSTWACLYGVSSLTPFSDPDFCRQVEALLDVGQDAVRQHFEFAYHLCSSFWEAYSLWTHYRIPVESGGYRFEPIPPDDPEYVGEIPDWLIQTSMAWLLAGIHALGTDRDLMQNVHWLKYRFLVGDTYLEKDHIEELEAALGYTIRLEDDSRARAMIEQVSEEIQRYLEGLPPDEPEAS